VSENILAAPIRSQNENARLVREAGILIFIIDEIAQYARISSSTL
jgi:hypothetical protein